MAENTQDYTEHYPSDVSDLKWEFCAPYLTLMNPELAEAEKGFVLLPRRWVVERTFAWLGRFRRLARDYERTSKYLAAYHWLAAISLMLGSFFSLPKSA
jgi:transposase